MEESRILALDFGEKRIGVAISDPLNIFAYPLVTLQNDSKIWDGLKNILTENKIEKVIIGYPFKESGAVSKISDLVLKFQSEIEKRFSIQTELVDERYSSSIAQQRIVQSIPSKKKRRDKSLIDKNAAAVFLEDYLNKKNKY